MSEAVRDAASASAPLRVRGAGHWLDAGGPVYARRTIALDSAVGIVEYVPGDLALTVLAGTALENISSACAAERQWLPLDPPGPLVGSIGATVATASYGPLAHSYGSVRDQLLGVEFVTGRGDVVRGGGRVTKNVAGFDLTRMVCGAWGTLGIITEVTLRVRALPDVDRTFALALRGDANAEALGELLRQLRVAAVTPTAMHLLDTGACKAVSLPYESALLLRFCGNDGGVRAQMARLAGAAPCEECSPAIWTRLREKESENAIVLRLSSRPSNLPQLWKFVANLCSQVPGARAEAQVGRGVVRFSLPGATARDLPRMLVEDAPALDRSLIAEKLPAELWPVLAPASGLGDRLTQRLRDAFDPQRLLNPGVMGEAPP